MPSDPFAAIFRSLVLGDLEGAGELSTIPVDLGRAPFSSAAFLILPFFQIGNSGNCCIAERPDQSRISFIAASRNRFGLA